jgi:hypothetical protein
VATKIYESIELELLDGTTIEVKPLSIKNLRAVMTAWKQTESLKDEDEFLNILVECTQLAMKQFAPSLSENREQLEDAVDLQTMYKILEVAADIKLNDPNQQEVAKAVLGMN